MANIVPLSPDESITASLIVGQERGDPALGTMLLNSCDRVRVLVVPQLHQVEFKPDPWMNDPRVDVHMNQPGGIAAAFINTSDIRGYHLVFSPSCQYSDDYVVRMVQKLERYSRDVIVGVRAGLRMHPVGFRLIPADEPLARDLPVHELDPRTIAYHTGHIRIPREPFGWGGYQLGSVLGYWAQISEVPLITVQRPNRWVTVRDVNEQYYPDTNYRNPDQTNIVWRLFAAGARG